MKTPRRCTWVAGWLMLCLSAGTVRAQDTWGKTRHEGQPWVRNVSRPYPVTHGMEGRHLSLWASHGCYFDIERDQWRWQRPALFCTNEDLFTQTIVVPYLIPMLENAGAVVFTPRERDWQRHEVIVDNDSRTMTSGYAEHGTRYQWTDAPGKGFATHGGTYADKENPFEAGKARMAETTRQKSRMSTVTYQPRLPEPGRYAVYVSYVTVDGSIDDAHYTVVHKGQRTEFKVNQQMGGGTWVYLGTFDFDQGSDDQNCVVLSNLSSDKGVVTADAVRFGGGMGNISRNGQVSNMPRCLEGARYYAQWAGMPYSVYSSKEGQNDYADDINARSLMTNYLTGGSCYAPDSAGLGVPIELTLAVHSDAGHTETGLGVYGSLAICTTQKGDSTLATGLSRQASMRLADDLLRNTTNDLQQRYGQWVARNLYDRNYSETRLPIVPSAILETMSHQNFGDMTYGQDPNFRFTLARSIYKTLLRYTAYMHGDDCVVTPLTPQGFHIEFTKHEGEVRIGWQGIVDSQEPTSEPTAYILYIAQGDRDFDNGTMLYGTSCTLRLAPGVLYSFRVAAVNKGGQSFKSEVLSALYQPGASHTALIVNGFSRLSAPAISSCGQGFDLDEDMGVNRGTTAGWLGRQVVFDTSMIGIEDSTGLGFSTSELAGRFIAGNTFDYVRTHAHAMATGGRLNIVSASAQAVEDGLLERSDYDLVDLILGLQKYDRNGLVKYKTMTPAMLAFLNRMADGGCNLLVSGAYTASDQQTEQERESLRQLLKADLWGVNRNASGRVRGLGIEFDFHRQPNETHYAATCTDILQPAGQSFPAMAYTDGETCAAVAYKGTVYNAFTMGFPLECITDADKRNSITRGIVNFLISK